MTADPHIVATWVKGWTLARETAPPRPYRDGFWVDVGWPQQKARYVFPPYRPRSESWHGRSTSLGYF